MLPLPLRRSTRYLLPIFALLTLSCLYTYTQLRAHFSTSPATQKNRPRGLATAVHPWTTLASSEPAEYNISSRADLNIINDIVNVLKPLLQQIKLQNTILPLTTWDKSQKIDQTGEHRFMPPGRNDLRGPCPGLNALANHGYLPRNGVTSLLPSVLAVNQVYGMGLDLALVLAIYTIVLLGDPLGLTWSIGGKSPTILPLLLGEALGLSNSHNVFESDGSVVAGDLYLNNGDSTIFDRRNLRKLLDLHTGSPSFNYDLDIMIQHKNWTLKNSIGTNPYFFSAPFSGALVTNAGTFFVPAFFSNFTQAKPAGELTKEMLLYWYGMQEDRTAPYGLRNLGKGYSRLPPGWHRRPFGIPYDYGFYPFAIDLMKIVSVLPDALKIGGNMGKVNSFVGVDLGDLTGGVYKTADLVKSPQSLSCFIYQFMSSVVPGLLRTRGGLLGDLLGDVVGIVKNLTTALLGPMIDPACPRIGVWDDAVLGKFPGSKIGGW